MCLRGFVSFVGVKEGVSHSGFAGPGEYFRTGLAGTHVPDAGFVPGVAHFRRIASLRSLLWERRKEIGIRMNPEFG